MKRAVEHKTNMMKSNTDKKPHFVRDAISRNLIIIASIVMILFFMPRNDSQTFHYDIGMPWLYGTFIAKFDFPIYKSDEAYKQECDSAMAQFQPYFTINNDIEREEIEKLEQDYKDGLPGLPAEYLRIVTNRLHRVYQAGIMSTQDYSELAQDSTRQVRIINGKETESRYISYLYSTRTAYSQLFIDDELGELRQVLQKCNLNEYIVPNVVCDKERTENEREEMINSIPPTKGIVYSGQKIIDRGDMVNEHTDRVIKSFEKEKKQRNINNGEFRDTLFGQIIFVILVVACFTTYLRLFRRDYYKKTRSMMMVYSLLTVFPIITSLVMEHNFFSVYIIPFCMVPIFTRVFLDSRTAFITHAATILICAAAVNYQYEFLIVQFVAGMAAVFSLREMSSRAQVLKTALLVSIASVLAYFSLQLMESNDLQKLDADMYSHFFINGVLLLLAYPLMYLIEKLFDFESDMTLFELSNTNKGVLRDLSEIAPGTFQHSITVANLAAEIASRIGADSLKVRTGALYHDIGKMENPVFFTENQAGVNPHDNLSSEQSARTIINHVTNGIRIAERNDLPQFIKDFILTHHGTGMTKYFFVKEQNKNPETEIDPTPFTYSGPNPSTREQAILMMTDSVEAASRSLSEYTEENISTLVNRIVDGQVAEGYFKECPINFRDIAIAKQILIDRLKNIYHTRISYPEATKKENNASQNVEPETNKSL